MFNINIGKLNKKITIQKLDKTKIVNDDEGNPTTDGWYDYTTKFASINNLYGSEFWSAKAVNEQDTINFIIRYSKDLEDMEQANGAKMYRILWKNKTYDITFVDNVEYLNTFYKIKAKAVN
ncbi:MULTISPECIES: phage head closure protein [Clostridium]|uniref:phage head closure protein n=1 Tax=Clostridium TaxID=1485 RepID=UPI000825A408|nr:MULTISPECIES: phage head closure protein [Clostridium]PJI09977.1 head-tail adaptor protein [Clostridium sp. CT7]